MSCLVRIFSPPPEDGGDARKCKNCEDGQLSLKVGRFGAFVGCSNYPDCRFTRQFSDSNDAAPGAANPDGQLLGKDPETDLDITLRTGRFGPYIQLGEPVDKEKPKRSSLPKGWEAASIDLEKALMLLSLPREVGKHPETGSMITAGLGRYGPFVLHEKTYANVSSIEEVFEVGINRAVTLIAEKVAGFGKGRPKATVLKDLGEHPEEGGKMEVLDGRYGPYVKHGKTNATVPKGKEPAELTVEEAVQLIAERIAKTGGKKKKPAKKKAAAKKPAAKKKAAVKKKAPAKKAAKKPAAKKTASKKSADA